MVRTQLAREIQEIKRAWGTKPDNDRDKDIKGKSWWKKKGDVVSEVAAEEDTPTTDAP